jgi:hypothetical protein
LAVTGRQGDDYSRDSVRELVTGPVGAWSWSRRGGMLLVEVDPGEEIDAEYPAWLEDGAG